MQVASVTFVETQVRNGTPPHASMAPKLPVVLGGKTLLRVGRAL